MATLASGFESVCVAPFREIASGLGYPEGPVYFSDGSVVLVEISTGLVSKVAPDGTKTVVAALGGGPNGAAIGPDGAIYICNDGGFFFMPIGPGLQVALGPALNYSGGRIERVSLDGKVETLYTNFSAKTPGTAQLAMHPLCSPDDLVFDKTGNFWFTDWGKTRLRDKDVTGVYYASPDGKSITEMIYPMQSPNGIGLSPAEDRLYVAESYTRRILYWELSGPGKIKPNPATTDGSYLLTAKIPFQACLDSLAVDEEGNVYVASFLPEGNDPAVNGGITVVSPQGEILEWIEIDIGATEPLPSNLCFGGPDRKTMYVTLSGTGRLIAREVRIAGKQLAFGA